jgi:Holliday junction resolvasome RuvABC endonuclease subunit
MIILALDPATSTGYCLVNISVDDDDNYTSADIYEYGFIDVDLTSEFQGDHCIDLMGRLQTIIDENAVEHITVEDYFFSKRTANGCNANAAFRTAIHILARQNEIEYTILNISAWKSFVAGRATATKEQKKRWGAEPAKKLYIQEALWRWYGFRFPNHSFSQKTGKPIAFRYDIVDVVGQAVYYCGLLCGIREITMSVEVPEDVLFKRVPKKMFVYGD